VGADLFVDGDFLVDVQSDFKNIEDLLGDTLRAMRNIDTSQIGPAPLRSRVNEFGDEWSYGVGQLGEFTGAVVDALQTIKDGFEETDTHLADALNEAAKGA
jgi:hypothetical protein